MSADTSIPYYEFGGNGPAIHFAHSNGFPPACFQQLISPLLSDYRVVGMCQRPLWPGSYPEDAIDWPTMADDLICFLDDLGLSDVVGIGHSSGAVVTVYAALRRPDLFRCLVLIDPVFLPPMILELLAANPALIHDVPVVKRAKNRRDRWSSRQEAFDRFRSKRVFQTWSDEVLWDYVNHATHQDPSGNIVLTYSREWEVRIYSMVPLDIWQLLPDLAQPLLAVRGANSDTLLPDAWQKWQQLQPSATFVQFENAGHMVLMEQPHQLAETIRHYLRQLEAG